MDLTKESVQEIYHGHKEVGTTRARLSEFNFPMLKGVLLRAPGGDDPVSNTNPIWVGGSAVTANSDPATGGVPLVPGATIFIPIDSPNRLWVISTASSQDIAWMGV